MATFDFTPMFRSSIGFERIPDLLAQALQRQGDGYPPYNIEKAGVDEFRIVMAVSVFSADDFEIVQAENRLTIKGGAKNDDQKIYLYRGLAARQFVREFDLADYVEVTGAELDNGLLVISLKRELPEAMKPRSIPITIGNGSDAPARSEKKAA
ncbi:Hsp20 family protein [Hyphomicrobium sp. DY-1]|uniref:Hsp20 family protein n=1 Tax=Hyphomicrobium sp. DY-1 TaxID=3075650 RepID=UPI0039C43250